MLAWFKHIFETVWPEGEPLIISERRVGTRLPAGSIVFAPGFSVERLDQEQLHQSGDTESQANSIACEAEHAR
jgi:hypothetical protein